MDDIRVITEQCLAWFTEFPPPRVFFTDMTPVLQFSNPPVPNVEVCFLEQGTIENLFIGDREVAIPEGYCSVQNLHFGNVSPARTERGRIHCLILDASEAPPELAYLRQRPVFATTVIDRPLELTDIFRRLRRLCISDQMQQKGYIPGVVMFDPLDNRRSVGSAWRLQGLLLELFSLILDSGQEGVPVLSEPIQRARALMDEWFIDPNMTLAYLAETACLSAAHFGRLFTREVGCAPMVYLQRLRLHAAALLLRQTGQRIEQIAEAIGYRDPLYFSKLFRRAYGRSPRAFRAAKETNP